MARVIFVRYAKCEPSDGGTFFGYVNGGGADAVPPVSPEQVEIFNAGFTHRKGIASKVFRMSRVST
jgi:hypothetical protein